MGKKFFEEDTGVDEFYSVISLDDLREDDGLSTAEEAFMRGYLEES